MTEQSDKPSVDLPERVVDVLMAEIGLSTYHPDGDLGPVLQAFAQAVKREVLARLPQQALAGPLEQPQEPTSDQANLAQACGVCDLQTALAEDTFPPTNESAQ